MASPRMNQKDDAQQNSKIEKVSITRTVDGNEDVFKVTFPHYGTFVKLLTDDLKSLNSEHASIHMLMAMPSPLVMKETGMTPEKLREQHDMLRNNIMAQEYILNELATNAKFAEAKAKNGGASASLSICGMFAFHESKEGNIEQPSKKVGHGLN